MRTTLNLPDDLVARAKNLARTENTTLTALIVDGLSLRVQRSQTPLPLPVSKVTGGLQEGITWDSLIAENSEDYR